MNLEKYDKITFFDWLINRNVQDYLGAVALFFSVMEWSTFRNTYMNPTSTAQVFFVGLLCPALAVLFLIFLRYKVSASGLLKQAYFRPRKRMIVVEIVAIVAVGWIFSGKGLKELFSEYAFVSYIMFRISLILMHLRFKNARIPLFLSLSMLYMASSLLFNAIIYSAFVPLAYPMWNSMWNIVFPCVTLKPYL